MSANKQRPIFYRKSIETRQPIEIEPFRNVLNLFIIDISLNSIEFYVFILSIVCQRHHISMKSSAESASVGKTRLAQQIIIIRRRKTREKKRKKSSLDNKELRTSHISSEPCSVLHQTRVGRKEKQRQELCNISRFFIAIKMREGGKCH